MTTEIATKERIEEIKAKREASSCGVFVWLDEDGDPPEHYTSWTSKRPRRSRVPVSGIRELREPIEVALASVAA